MRRRLAEYHSLWQEKAGDDHPMIPVRAHGGRREPGGERGPRASFRSRLSIHFYPNGHGRQYPHLSYSSQGRLCGAFTFTHGGDYMATATVPYYHINPFRVRLIPEGFENNISHGSIPVSTMMPV